MIRHPRRIWWFCGLYAGSVVTSLILTSLERWLLRLLNTR